MSSFYETIKEAKLILKIYTSYVFLYTKILAERPENAEFKKNEKLLKGAFRTVRCIDRPKSNSLHTAGLKSND